MSSEAEKAIDFECADCGSKNVRRHTKEISFPYGVAPKTVTLRANVPVFACQNCGAEFLGEEAEEIQHEAICDHLGVMTPKEIAEIVRSNGLDRESFAKLSKIGIATLGRWERGEYIQLPAYDQFLYLMSFRDNQQRLRQRKLAPQDAEHMSPDFENRTSIDEPAKRAG